MWKIRPVVLIQKQTLFCLKYEMGKCIKKRLIFNHRHMFPHKLLIFQEMLPDPLIQKAHLPLFCECPFFHLESLQIVVADCCHCIWNTGTITLYRLKNTKTAASMFLFSAGFFYHLICHHIKRCRHPAVTMHIHNRCHSDVLQCLVFHPEYDRI